MKKFTLAASAALALAAAAPAVADTKTTDDPFVSTQFAGFTFLGLSGGGAVASLIGVTIGTFAIASSGDS
jgi:hypothetical protein